MTLWRTLVLQVLDVAGSNYKGDGTSAVRVMLDSTVGQHDWWSETGWGRV